MPFMTDSIEINQHYGGVYSLKCLASVDVVGGLKGICEAKEVVWHLSCG